MAEAETRLAEAAARRRLSGRRARRDRASCRHRHHQIRRSLQSSAPRTIFSTWSASPNSKARPGLICNMRRCASSRSCARRGGRATSGHARHPFAGRAQSGAPASFAGRRLGGGGRQARAQHAVRICLRPGAEFQPLLFGAHHVLSETDADCAPRGWDCVR